MPELTRPLQRSGVGVVRIPRVHFNAPIEKNLDALLATVPARVPDAEHVLVRAIGCARAGCGSHARRGRPFPHATVFQLQLGCCPLQATAFALPQRRPLQIDHPVRERLYRPGAHLELRGHRPVGERHAPRLRLLKPLRDARIR